MIAARAEDTAREFREDVPVDVPETRYAWNEDVALAYQVIGDGPVDLVYYQGLESHVDPRTTGVAPPPTRADPCWRPGPPRPGRQHGHR
jgi:hypothetical protein